MQIRGTNINKKYIIIAVSVVLIVAIIIAGICVASSKAKKEEETTAETTIVETATETTAESTTETTTEETTQETTTLAERTVKQANVNVDWNMVLVNPWNKIPSDYQDSIKLTQLEGGHAVDSRCYPDLQEMMDACREAGLNPVICSSYRSQATQEYLYNRKINQFKDMGYSDENAKLEAGKIVAVPGTSEHQLGLAVDVVDSSYQILDEGQEKTDTQKWLMDNSYKYGWILRYPNSKRSVTGIIYEPWHYRYVGKDVAKEVYDSGLCFEEYLQTK